MRHIFCGNLEYDARQCDLERMFRRYGKVDRVDMKSGFAFIFMEDERDAEDAIRALDQIEFGRKARRLRVEWTKHESGIRRPGSSKRSSADRRPSKTLFVINFDAYHTRTRDLERHFEPYGKIVSVRIRRNFAFVQYGSEDDAIKAFEATNLSKLMDQVISVEYAVKDNDDRRNRYSHNRRQSPSPYQRERGRPECGLRRSRSPHRRERGSPDYGCESPRSYRGERDASDHFRSSNHSPYHKEQMRSGVGNPPSPSPDGRERISPQNGRDSSHISFDMRRASPENGHGSRQSPDSRANSSPYNDYGGSPNCMPEPRDSPNYSAPESPMHERNCSHLPSEE